MEVLAQGTNSINVFTAIGLKSGFISTALANVLLLGFNGVTLGVYLLALFATPILYCHNVLRISKMADVVQRQALAAANNFSRNFSKSVLQQAASGALSVAGDAGSNAAMVAAKGADALPLNLGADDVQVVIDKLGPAVAVAGAEAAKGATILAKGAVDVVSNPKESAIAVAGGLESGAGALHSLGSAAAPHVVQGSKIATIGVVNAASEAAPHLANAGQAAGSAIAAGGAAAAPVVADVAQSVAAGTPGALQAIRVQAISAARGVSNAV